MSEGLEALERMFKDIEQCSIDLARADLDDYKIIEKELKAFEIIKTKKVDTFSLRKLTLEEYNYGVKLGKKNILVYECELITQEEYDLLKEVLQ